MTEHVTKRLRRTVGLPSISALDVLVRWACDGPGTLAPEHGPEGHVQRSRMMVCLRRLVSTLPVPHPLADEILETRRNRDFGALSVDLLAELARQARLGGYVTAGCRERVPLTPVQAHIVQRLSYGATYEDIIRTDGGRNSALSESIGRARKETGCATTAQLMACAFRNGWLPDQEELNVLLSGHMVWDTNHLNPWPPYRRNES